MRVEDLRKKGLIIYEVISGSRAYGTNKPTSDTDIRGVYLAPLDEVLGNNYQEQVNDDTNDTVFYELKRFVDLVHRQNPNILEMLYMPDDCVVYKHPLMDEIFEHRDKFLTKTCQHSFGGYAISQIKKAKGLNKKINNPQPVVRKTPLDFCYFMVDGKSVAARDYLFEHNMKQEHVGLVSLEHMRFTYAAHYDKLTEINNALGDRPKIRVPEGYKPFKGIIQSEELSNDISLSEVPKFYMPFAYMQFNKDAYQVHCKDYLEDSEWVKKRNPDRYEVTVSNGNNYDAKNMMHCIRLLRVAKEIATEGKVNVRRADRDELMFIRNGQANYDQLIKEADEAINKIDDMYRASALPESIDKGFMDGLLLSVRKKAYKL